MKTIILLICNLISISIFGQPKSFINSKDTALYLPWQRGRAPFSINGKMGIIDTAGKIIQPAKYDRISNAFGSDFIYYFADIGRQTVVLDRNFKTVIGSGYDDIGIYQGHVFIAKNDGNYTYLDSTGKQISDWYDYAFFLNDGIGVVKINNKYAYVDSTGKQIPGFYDEAKNFTNGSGLVKTNNKWGAINRYGTFILQPVYDKLFASYYSEYFAYYSDGKWGFIDKTGKIQIPAQYSDVHLFREGLAAVEINGKWGFINDQNQLVLSAIYQHVTDFGGAYAGAELNHHWGFIDYFGNTIIPFSYKKVKPFGEFSIATNVKTGLFSWKMIDRNGNDWHFTLPE